MIRIAIVDDEREILELLFRIIDDTLKREQAQFEITTFLKAEELLSSHRTSERRPAYPVDFRHKS